MKTSVPMQRNIAGYEFNQRTKDSYFDAGELLSKWNSKNTRRRIDDFLSSKNTKEFLDVLIDEIAIGEISPLPFEVKKGRKTSKGATKDQVWMHPYLFIKFAMWINPTFELKVIKFVYDELIKQRNDAGDNYKVLSSAGARLQGYDYVEVARAMQWIIFNKTGKGLRQLATESQLKELNDLQTKLAFAVDMEYIKTYDQLISELRKIYNNKYSKF